MIPEGKVILKQIYSYDTNLYTQGIEKMNSENLLISAGRYGFSQVGIYNLDASNYKKKIVFDEHYFAEGLTIVNNYFWLLSFKEEIATLYDLKSFKKVREKKYEGQGWGLAYDNNQNCLWMTNGSNVLQKRDPSTFALIENVPVEVFGIPISRINELEFVEGYLFGNIWETNKIVKLDPNTGQILKYFDLSTILSDLKLDKKHYPFINFLNGIAHKKGNTFFITGKLYPHMLEVELY